MKTCHDAFDDRNITTEEECMNALKEVSEPYNSFDELIAELIEFDELSIDRDVLILDTGIIKGKQMIEYEYRMWLDNNIEDETLIKNKSLSYKIEAEVQQKEVRYIGMIKSTGITIDPIDENFDLEAFAASLPKDNYWQYREQITSVVFENKVDIPDTVSVENQWDVSILGDHSVMAYVEEDGTCTVGSGEEVVAYKLHIQGNGKIIANVDSSFMFPMFYNVQEINNLNFLDTSNVTNMYWMFFYCESLKKLDISHFDTSNVTDMNGMFYSCRSLTSLDVSHFDTANVTNIRAMFDSVPTDSQILVKDEVMKNWVLGVRNNLTNVVVKNI